MDERFVFKFETSIKTFRGYFDSDAPTGKALFTDVMQLCSSQKIGEYSVGEKGSISIQQVELKGNYCRILFRLTDENIPDHLYYNPLNGSFRLGERQEDEKPAISCHMVIDVSSEHDDFRSYPTAVENVPYLSRSTVYKMLNLICSDHFRSSRDWVPSSGKGKMEKRDFTPRLKARAKKEETIEGLLDRKGKLKEISLTEDTLSDVAGFEPASIKSQSRDIRVRFNSTFGDVAKNGIEAFFKDDGLPHFKRASVTIEDPDTGKDKVIRIDNGQSDLMKSAFIPQIKISDISPPLRMCEVEIHADLCCKIEGQL